MENSELSKLQLDYQQTVDQFKTLADIRFKLLAFVPTLAGAAIALLTGSTPVTQETSLAVGILGFLVTVGITFYDIRNTQFYDAAVHRAKWLEAMLDLPICTADGSTGGYFSERPQQSLRFFGLVAIWHDRGLALAYGSALGGWAYVSARASLVLMRPQEQHADLALLIAVVVGLLCGWEYQRLSSLKKPVPNEALLQQIERRSEARQQTE